MPTAFLASLRPFDDNLCPACGSTGPTLTRRLVLMADPITVAPDESAERRRTRERRALVGKRIYDLASHPDAWVTAEQIAQYYGVALKTVKRKWIDGGLLEAHRFPGHNTRVRVRTLQQFEAQHQIVPQGVL